MIILPWIAKELNPNSKRHWTVKAKFTKKARSDAHWATKDAGYVISGTGSIHLHIYFYPPDKRKRDGTNMLASMKAAFDGIADALGVDDVRFHVTYEVCRPHKGGEVRVIVTG